MAEYFKELLNNLNIDTENFTFKEVSKVVKSIKTGKSPGNDHNVTQEALKHRGDQLIEYLHKISHESAV